jgi:sugar phosphate isomerase/epimerase
MLKLALSNLAWPDHSLDVLRYVSDLGVQGIEVAPTRLAPWGSLTLSIVSQYRIDLENVGLCIPSFQAILFGKSELQLLGSELSFSSLCRHIDFISRLARVAGASILVFGAPKNRLLLDNSLPAANDLAVFRLKILADIAFQNNVSIGLEAVPKKYGCEFITSYIESLDIVHKVAHPGLVFHLDSGCTYLNNDDLGSAICNAGDAIRHFHVSEPHLCNLNKPSFYHSVASNALRHANYSHWICIEMVSDSTSFFDLKTAINFVKLNYFDMPLSTVTVPYN